MKICVLPAPPMMFSMSLATTTLPMVSLVFGMPSKAPIGLLVTAASELSTATMTFDPICRPELPDPAADPPPVRSISSLNEARFSLVTCQTSMRMSAVTAEKSSVS